MGHISRHRVADLLVVVCCHSMCCAMCTCGVSLLLPNVCVSEAEKHANMLLGSDSHLFFYM
jgi:hypothetical protein